MLLELGGELNRLSLERAKLATEKAHLAERLERQETAGADWAMRTQVRDVDVHIEPLDNAMAEQTLVRRVLADMRILIGKNIADVTAAQDLLFRSFANRAYAIDGKTYFVTLKALVIGPTVTLYVVARNGAP